MRFSRFALWAAALFQVGQCATTTTTDDTSITIPTCGLKCIIHIIPTSVCASLENVTCICTNEEVIATLGACVLDSCSIEDALSTEKYSDYTCGRTSPDNSLQVIVTTPLFGALAVLVWLLRVWSRYLTGFKATWGLDDWIMVPVVIGSIPMTALSFILAKHGLGKDMWWVSFDDITYILYLYFWDEILYNFVIPATKISICCFYLRIFPREGFRRWTYVIIAGNICYIIAFEAVTIFQCTPIPGAWLNWNGEGDYSCRNVNLQAWIAAAVSIVLDVATIALPMPELWKLNLSMRKRLQVMLMFAVGIFVTIVSILRLQYLLDFANTTNVTQDFVPIGVWSTVETNVSIMCACLPALKTLIGTIAPKMFGTTHDRSAKSTEHSILSTKKSIPSKIKLENRPKGQDEASFIELTPIDSDEERHIRKTSHFDLEIERSPPNPAVARESV